MLPIPVTVLIITELTSFLSLQRVFKKYAYQYKIFNNQKQLFLLFSHEQRGEEFLQTMQGLVLTQP